MRALVGVVVVAAGSGVRLGARRPKALAALAGRPIVAHAVAGVVAAGLPPPVVVHHPHERRAFARALSELPVASLAPGGATRTGSVRAGLAALGADVQVVMVHDAARPLTPPAVMQAVLAAVLDDDTVLAAAPATAVADTLKQVDDGVVVATVDRTRLVAVQTPQVVRRAALEHCLAGTPDALDATDDLGLVERALDAGELRGRVVVVPGSPWGLKVTTPEDLAVAELLAGAPPAREPRTLR